MSMRVRQVLDGIGGNGRRGLEKYMPEYNLPEDTKGVFPAKILSSYAENKYSEVGILTEKFVLSPYHIGPAAGIGDNLTHVEESKRPAIYNSKTSLDYLHKIEDTKIKLHEFIRKHGYEPEDMILNQELTGKNIVGHPDAIIGTEIVIEVKTTSKLEKDHKYFMQQLCSYMALNKNFKYGILVLPLQSEIIVIEDWNKRDKFLNAIEDKAKKLIKKQTQQPSINMLDLFNIKELISYYSIGKHVQKSKTFMETVTNMIPEVPYQIFIGGNQTSKLNLNEEDLKAAGEYVKNNNIKLYIHAPYIINLATKTPDDWNIEYMRKTMKYGVELGAAGVVVHVGKSTSQDLDVATENMVSAINEILKVTDESCPLLIETPAGQGTEMLKDIVDYVDFIDKIMLNNPEYSTKIGSCVDTCHVFACGNKPSEYIETINGKGYLKLVHYNDSNDICGSCKDRHAFAGQGHIGIAEMTAVADYCGAYKIPMVIE